MKKSLKLKILASFMLLNAILIIAGAVSIFEFNKLSSSVNDLIQDNYRSIESSKSMLEALEREDSGILLLLLGEWEHGRSILNSADSAFAIALSNAKNNLTEVNEDDFIMKIDSSYQTYKNTWQRPIVNTDKQGDISWYKDILHNQFNETKVLINSLMTLNQDILYKEASELQEKATRAIMPGIISILSALLFSLILNFFISKYFINPIAKIAKAINVYKVGDYRLNSNITSSDEIKDLENNVNELIAKVNNKDQ